MDGPRKPASPDWAFCQRFLWYRGPPGTPAGGRRSGPWGPRTGSTGRTGPRHGGVEGFQLGKAGTEGHRGQSFQVCVFWRGGGAVFPEGGQVIGHVAGLHRMATSAPQKQDVHAEEQPEHEDDQSRQAAVDGEVGEVFYKQGEEVGRHPAPPALKAAPARLWRKRTRRRAGTRTSV